MLAPPDHPLLLDDFTDLELLERYRSAGDQEAFAEIVNRYAAAVFSTALRILGDRARADDVSQDTFFRLSQKPDSVRQSLGGWLHTAATRLSIDLLRSENSRTQRETNYQPKPAADATKWSDVSPHVDQALAELPDDTRLLLVRHFLQKVSQCQLATEMNTSPATISRRIKSAVDALRAQLARRGVCIGAALLFALLREHSAHAAPAELLLELGKITMLSGNKPTASAASAGTFAGGWTWVLSIISLAAIFAVLWMVLWNRVAPTSQPIESHAPPAATR